MKVFREVGDRTPATGKSRVFHQEENVRLVGFHLEEGELIEPHTSESTVFLHVVEGSGTFRSNDDEALLGSGESALFGPGEEHAVEAVESPLIFLAVLAPGPR